MKELDFDELDKAVNSLMSNVSKENTDSQEEKTVTIPSSNSAPSTPSAVPETPTTNVSVPSRSTPSSPSNSLASRRGGRFMDVVHPSADMKKSEPTKPVSRQGTTITPSAAPDVSAEPAASTPVVTTPVPGPPAEEPTPSTISPSAPEITPTLHQPQAQSDWPDPLDMAAKKEAAPMPTATQEEKPEEKTEPAIDTAPLTSPFLPDAKVEKRPLGGAQPKEDEETPELSTEALGKEGLTVDDPNAQLPPAPAEPEAPLPEELQGDLVAIESGSAKGVPAEEAIKPSDTTLEEKPAEATQPAASSVEKPATPSGPVSIPKQYQEEPSTGEQKNGAIYDTNTYHQPLAHPTKQKSGWMWVLWIVLILAAGASIGAALYFLGVV